MTNEKHKATEAASGLNDRLGRDGITFKDVAKKVPECRIITKPNQRQSVTIDFMMMDNGEIGVFGFELKNRFSVQINGTFADA